MKHKRFSTNVNGKEEQAIWDIFEFEIIAAPTQSLLQRWIREEHSIFVFVEITRYQHELRARIVDYREPFTSPIFTNSFSTYEQALEAGLLEALKLIKT